ncbi:hypothetical protein SteCoe_35347 [Stentor coeruleus]|uniref:Uncharacterized protein n=1 Tax=Stentor coeruleus TaxID=5963 RepID=A0A1R2ASM1_9CILI|nr:hypothetical protein SteCoe_35347 [Stentor coeruleus]
MEVKNTITEVYGRASPICISNHRYFKKFKKSNKIANINHSFTSTRDQSSNRSKTPIKPIENTKLKGGKYFVSKEETGLEKMRKKLDVILQTLPGKTNKDKNLKKKVWDLTFDCSKDQEINRIYQVNSSNRSKSSFTNKKKTYLPKIKKDDVGVEDLQKYVLEFHQKSKLLLSQLEEKVLGKRND